MSLGLPEELFQKLKKRKEEASFRVLRKFSNASDFSSNDYLGFAKSDAIRKNAEEILNNEIFINGSTGSRLVTGNHLLQESTENYLANFHQADAALLYNSGYDANVGLFSSVLQKGNFILYDELIHASIRDGIRLSNATAYKFQHNNLEDLKKKFSKCDGTVFIAVESVYSMDGDSAPLKELVAFSEVNNCFLIVDEAHSTGVFGEKGTGLAQQLQLQNKLFARVHTFGKAMGCHGAVVLGSNDLRDYLINFSRSFIYTTAASLHSVATIKASYNELEHTNAIKKLHDNIRFFTATLIEFDLQSRFIKSESAIQCCVFEGNEKVKAIAQFLQEKGFDVKAILAPTVPKGQERLRICLHSFNTEKEITEVLQLLATFA